MKPKLPKEIEKRLPSEVVYIIRKFISHNDKPSPPMSGLQKQLSKLQRSPKLSSMGLYNLDDFVLL